MNVRYEIDAGIATITLDRPDKRNAVNVAMARAINQAFEDAEADGEVRVVVITGAGKGFCAGADLELLGGSEESLAAIAREDELRPELPMLINKPVVAAVNGAAAGMGFTLMLAADIRFAAAGAKLTTSFARLGLVAEHGLSWLLPRLVGVAGALDLLLTGRTITSEEANVMGLVQRVLPADQVLPAAIEYARAIADRCSPHSLATIKRQVFTDLHQPFDAAYAAARELMLESFRRPELAEALAARAEGRGPRFGPNLE